jgi:DNA invertase Pin-like site-specific DNA recombinase
MPEIPDIDRLIAEVAARHGILLKRDDAAFALVTLNQLVLESSIADLSAEMQAASAEFERAMDRVQERAGIAVAKQARTVVHELACGLSPARDAGPTPPNREALAQLWSLLWAFTAGLAAGVLVSWLR